MKIQLMSYKNMIRIAVIVFLAFVNGLSQNGYHIDVQIDNVKNDTMYLAYFYGDANYISDTAFRRPDGHFVFQSDQKLAEGIYMFVLPPENSFFQIMIDDDNQNFSLKTDADNIVPSTVITGSPDNVLFYDYLRFLEDARHEKAALQAKKESAGNESVTKKTEEELIALDRNVLKKQEEIIRSYPNSLTAMLISSSREPQIPEYTELPEAERNRQVFQYYHQHYFDFLDLDRPAILRTPFIHQKVMDYFEKYTYQEPDSLNKAMDRFFSGLDEEGNTYRYFLVKLLNKYANPTLVGQDAIYVHLAQNYYGKGKAPWVDEETLEKILDNADRFSYTLIGKTAPDLKLFDYYNDKDLELKSIKADYKVLIFWSSTCSHCTKIMPTLPDLISKINDSSVQFVSVCTKADESCKEFTEEHDLSSYGIYAYPTSAYGRTYDVRSTPKVFVIDKDNKIASKGIGFEQIPEVIKMLKGENSGARSSVN